jgi:hypothetical protein
MPDRGHLDKPSVTRVTAARVGACDSSSQAAEASPYARTADSNFLKK